MYPKKQVSAAVRTRGPAVRLLEGLEQVEPLDGGRGGEHTAAAGDHGGDPGRVQRRL